jgi:twitching motility protein PilT
MDVDTLLRTAADMGASDLHLRSESVPIVRLHGALVPLNNSPHLTPEDTSRAFEHITNEHMRKRFASNRDLDFPYALQGVGRFRVNASVQRGTIALAFRRIDLTVPTIEELNLPPICKTLALLQRGLILVTGPTGTGKSTTLAAMIDHLNQNESRIVIAVEDPIEYLYQDKKCVITQREVGRDTQSFASALRSALRQDVDVILVGELRDLETMAACLTAAETGHLVLSTLHTSSAPMTIDRIIDSFPPHQQDQIRMQLSLTLEGVLSQVLLPRIDQDGRVPAVEIMVINDAIRNLIREGKTHQMQNVIQTGVGEGMQTMEQALKGLYQRNMISLEAALAAASNKGALRQLIELT